MHSEFFKSTLSAVLGGLVVGLVLVSVQTFAQEEGAVPEIFSYSGSLDHNGALVTDDVDMTFEIFNAREGGEVIWSEDWSGDNRVPVSQGRFTVPLGMLSSEDQSLGALITQGGDLFIGVSIDGQPLAGRQQITPSPYAMLATRATRADAFRVDGELSVGGHTRIATDKTLFLGTNNATLNTSPGALAIGDLTGPNLGFDKNEILARNNGESSALYLQAQGGRVIVGEDIYVQGLVYGDRRLRHVEVSFGNNDEVSADCGPNEIAISCGTDKAINVSDDADVMGCRPLANKTGCEGWVDVDGSRDNGALLSCTCLNIGRPRP